MQQQDADYRGRAGDNYRSISVSRVSSSRGEKTRGNTAARSTRSTPMTDGKIIAVALLSFSSHSVAKQNAWTAVNFATFRRPSSTMDLSTTFFDGSRRCSSTKRAAARPRNWLPVITFAPKKRKTPQTTASGTSPSTGAAFNEASTSPWTTKPVSRVSTTDATPPSSSARGFSDAARFNARSWISATAVAPPPAVARSRVAFVALPAARTGASTSSDVAFRDATSGEAAATPRGASATGAAFTSGTFGAATETVALGTCLGGAARSLAARMISSGAGSGRFWPAGAASGGAGFFNGGGGASSNAGRGGAVSTDSAYVESARTWFSDWTVAEHIQGSPNKDEPSVMNASAARSRWYAAPFFSLFCGELTVRTVMFWSRKKSVARKTAGTIASIRYLTRSAPRSTAEKICSRGAPSFNRSRPPKRRAAGRDSTADAETTTAAGPKSASNARAFAEKTRLRGAPANARHATDVPSAAFNASSASADLRPVASAGCRPLQRGDAPSATKLNASKALKTSSVNRVQYRIRPDALNEASTAK
mmetsp:Transcript_16443/g.50848  ORF Transcript_16443/g.50848 Transcript_16443/m.50848 type:complete len:536 (+) Transcript_16443:105-1712(+)